MRQDSRRLVSSLLSVMVATVTIVPGRLSAAEVVVPRTGQTLNYLSAPFADGAVQAGVANVSPRFLANGDGSSTDQVTWLEWAGSCNLMATRDPAFDTDGDAGDGYVTWQHALEYVAALNAAVYLGHSDWRLPNALELQSVDNLDAQDTFEWLLGIDDYTSGLVGQPFTDVKLYLWSSTTVAGTTTSAWVWSTIEPSLFAADKSTFEATVWPVRGVSGVPPRLWRSGQTASYHAGDDGDLEAGAAWPVPRFVNHGNGTVTDQLTGLMWTRQANSPGPATCIDQDIRFLPWYYVGIPNAMDYVACLNAIPYLGYDDWRLPNRTELRSLVDHSAVSPALPTGHPFLNVQTSLYWTASDYFDDNHAGADYVYYVHLADGRTGGGDRMVSRWLWPVRGGLVGASSATYSAPDPVTWLVLFPDTEIGSSSTKILTVTSTGQTPLAIGTAALDSGSDPAIAITGDSCTGALVQPASTCQVTLTLTPSTAGTAVATLLLPSSADGLVTARMLTFRGEGVVATDIFADGFENGSSSAWSHSTP